MTRETKIGLLVGLAFIVVFAMLLSHTGSTPSPGDPLQLAKAKSEPAPKSESLSEPIGPAAPVTNVKHSQESASRTVADKPAISAHGSPPELPNPGILNLPLGASLAPDADAMASTDNGTTKSEALEMTRVAPPLPVNIAPPEPTVHPDAPTPSPEPNKTDSVVAVTTPSTPSDTPKEYVVQKGQTLVQIIKALYGSGSRKIDFKKVKDFFVQANHIKNAQMLTAGQKLVVPTLPPEMFEPVIKFDAAKSNEIQKASKKLDEMVNARHAPMGTKKQDPPVDKPDKSDKTDKTVVVDASKSSKGGHTYEIQANDTLSSIAKDQLGTATSWREIQKLNKDLDPSKMKPGMKIKLPAKHAASDAGRT